MKSFRRRRRCFRFLKEAGVVDSGGQGLLEVIRGAYDAFLGKEIDYSALHRLLGNSTAVKVSVEEEKRLNLATVQSLSFFLEKEFTENDEHELKAYLSSIGDSIVCVADDEIVKIHVHIRMIQDLRIQKALTYGQLSRMKIDNMREEHREN